MKTKIPWCDETWNPITGCTPISEGCQNCYAKKMANRLQGSFGYPDKPNQFDVTFHPERLHVPAQRKKPTTYFVNSMSDTFHDTVEWNALFSILQMCGTLPRHKFLLLTKRPKRMYRELVGDMGGVGFHLQRQSWCKEWPLSNIWLGVTAENQKRFDERWNILSQIPATVKFISIEPALEYVNIDMFPPWPDWVIWGPETGLKKRPFKSWWAEETYKLCQLKGIPFFDKREKYLAREFPKKK